MNKVEYKAIKKLAIAQFGADDAESLIFFAENIEKRAKIMKWVSIVIGIISLPLCFIIIGMPLIIVAILIYVFGYRKSTKRAQMFKEYVNNDPELSAT